MATHKTDNAPMDITSESNESIDRNAPTQVGQVFAGNLSSLTDRLPRSVVRRRSQLRTDGHTSNEQIADLISALGEPDHPEHARAVDRLVDIGRPAIPPLIAALDQQQQWLTSYRAAEALGYIGSGSASGALIRTLQHSNSNVRWSAVRALAQIGDLRALMELRRVARDDHGRTSWGESIAGTAQSALDQIHANSVWGQSVELFKTAFTSVLMILALILAFGVISTLRQELTSIEHATPEEIAAITNIATEEDTDPMVSSDMSDVSEDTTTPPVNAADLTPEEPAPMPAEETGPIVGTVLMSSANVRPFPSANDDVIGLLSLGDEVQFLARTPDHQWYRVALGSTHAPTSYISNPDGTATGWVHRMLLSTPTGDIPIEDLPTPIPAPEDTVDTDDTGGFPGEQ